MQLGDYLKKGRNLIGFTLRQVEESVNISNAYLSQLENNKIKKPSATVLYKLACLYRLDLDELLILSGKIKPEDRISVHEPNSIFGKIPLTEEEEKQLLKYLNFLRFGN